MINSDTDIEKARARGELDLKNGLRCLPPDHFTRQEAAAYREGYRSARAAVRRLMGSGAAAACPHCHQSLSA